MLQKAKENLSTIVIIFAIITAVAGADRYFASAADLVATQQRLDYKIVSDQVLDLEKRLFIIESRHNINVPGKTPIPMMPDVLENYHKLKMQLQKLYKEQDAALKGS